MDATTLRGELHVTLAGAVAPPPGFRRTHVVLARGEHPVQEMLTARVDAPDLPALRARARAMLRALPAPLRVKLEVALPDDPRLRAALNAHYTEFHVKVAVTTERLGALGDLARAHGAHLSRTDADDATPARYLTLRDAPDAPPSRLDALRDALAAAGFAVRRARAEAVLDDTNLALDDGWMEPHDA